MSPQQSIAHYRIVSKLGEGGMGVVYRATDTKLNRDVAIKILPEAFAADPGRLARFTREAQVLASLNHPNIAAIYGVEERALVMELVEGLTLAERIAGGATAEDEALGIAKQIAEALEYAHERGIVHRDLKPANIKITPGGRVKVLDFGLAKLSRGAEDTGRDSTQTLSMTAANVIVGTPRYMAPEQAQRMPLDKRADIWAFGVVLFEMLTGEHLFAGDSTAEVLAAVLTQEIEWTSAPPRARRLLKHCLERDPGKRLRDIADISLLLEEQGETVLPRRGAERIVIALLAAVSLALGGLLWRAPRTQSQPQTLMRFDADLGPEAVADSGEGSMVVLSPDATRLAYVARRGQSLMIATRLLGQAAPTLLAGTDGAYAPFFSPDGRWLGFFAGSKMKKLPVDGGPVVTLCDVLQPRGAWWGSDGYILTNVSAGSGLYRVPESGGNPERLTNPATTGEATHRFPQMLPGGRAVLFTGHAITANYDEANIEVLSLTSGKWKTVQRGGYFGRYVPTGHLLYVSQSTLYSVPFDLNRLEVRGATTPLLDDVAGNRNNGNGGFDARNGMLVYASNRSLPAKWPVAWIDRTGGQEMIPLEPAGYSAPRISPDGGRLLLAAAQGGGGSDIEVYDFRRQTTTRLTFTHNNTRPVWAPDGKHIVFTTESSRSIALRWMRADGTGETRTLLEDQNEMDPWSFSPDGHLAFAWLAADAAYHLWTLPLELSDADNPKAGHPQLFLRSSFSKMQPAFSPDGRWIAYVTREPGAAGLYVSAFPPAAGGDSPKWQISTRGNFPVWSRTRPELFYQSDGRIMVVSYDAGKESFIAGKPQPWSNRPRAAAISACCDTWYTDLSADGQRFLIFPIPEATGSATRTIDAQVLLNFFDYLRQRVPPGK